ncbi:MULTISPECIES: ABC transporter permease [Klebsiella]|uniref:ABC transporter permease n=1 Tax=Klebsiella TaxID=570 RepID=UPI0009B59020|nr:MULTISPECIES: ABC transporter permease [Klebsiella]EKZ9877703.1 ABC transporter permease [Klebsiella pneumoniae]ELA0424952.1 ABC transporter permease [Klebsiella pneumoniae]MDE1098481.1 ABC transporter permease [Klebsiella pneumoniae]MEE2284058.1 ABC transporter permease [Klebsiella pneumoniae]ROF87208.1 ABC transporter permease [Klebsiella pneumoniae subsp. pneumoniae]
MKKKSNGATAIVTAILLVLVALWELAAQVGLINGQLLGSPVGIFNSAVIGFTQGQLLNDTWVTFVETALGLVTGSVLGIILGLVLWFYPRLSDIVKQFSMLLNSIPKIALGPLIIIWFGSGMISKVWLAGISTFAVAMISSCAAAEEVDKDLLNLFRSFKAQKSMIFKKLILPASVPWIFSIFRINIGFALIGAVVGEFIASENGLGHAVFVAGSLFDLNTVWLGVIILTLMAAVLTWIVQLIEERVVSWKIAQ